jgi:hypothetical protein
MSIIDVQRNHDIAQLDAVLTICNVFSKKKNLCGRACRMPQAVDILLWGVNPQILDCYPNKLESFGSHFIGVGQ